jgi:hypothetical protein
MRDVKRISSLLQCAAREIERYTVFVPNAFLRCLRSGFAALAGGTMVLSALASAGCEGPPLSESDARSQYDRYDTIRNQHAPSRIEDEFGYLKPNLRGRLLRRD